MAKRDDESLLLRSAESLGRMIGSLQRQLDIATGRLADSKPNASGRKRAAAKSKVKARSGAAKSRAGARKKSAVRKKSAARKRAKKR